MKLTKEEYVDLVKREIEGIRQHAAPEEKAKLDFKTLDTTKHRGCIYGQMTGSCFSTRAGQIIKLIGTGLVFKKLSPFYESHLKARLSQSFVLNRHQGNDGFTSLEYYIISSSAFNKQIIQYIRDEIDALPDLLSIVKNVF